MELQLSPAFVSLLEDYKHEYMGARNLAERSRVEYETDLVQFLAFLSGLPIRDIRRVEAKHIKAYLADLDRQQLRSSSRRRKLTVIRTFFAWLNESGYISNNPSLKVVLLQRRDPQPRVLCKAEYQRLLGVVQDPRDRAIIQLVLQTGILLSELHRLNVADIRLPKQIGEYSLGRMHIRGNRKRMVILNAKACQALDSWLQVRTRSGNDAVFRSSTSRRRLSERQIQNIVGKYLEAAAINDAGVHALRHTFATHHLAQGTAIETVQEILGHEDPNSTEVYIPLANKQQASDLQNHAL